MEYFNSRFLRKAQGAEVTMPTKIRCMRRVSVNFEANGNRRGCGYMPMGSLFYPGYGTPQEHKFEQMDHHMGATNLVYGLSTHEIPMKQSFDTNLCRVSEVSDLTCENNCVSQETINALKSVIRTLECNRSNGNESVRGQGSPYSTDRMGSGAALDDTTAGQGFLYSTDNTSLNSTDRGGRRRSSVTFANDTAGQESVYSCQDNCGQYCPGMDGNQQLNTLTDLMRQTLFKLDNYMALQAKQQRNQYNLEPYLLPEVPVNVPTCMDPFLQMQMKAKQQQQPPKGRARRTVKVMPVQPLVIMPAAAPQPAPAPAAPPAPALYRPERHRMRPRKRRAAPETAAAAATKTAAAKETKRDSGTTMWCPSRCCQCFCGVNASGGREFKAFTQTVSSTPLHGGYCSPSDSPAQATKLTASLSPSHETSLSPSHATSLSPSLATSYTPSHATSYSPSLSPSQARSLSPSQSRSLSPSHTTSFTPSLSPSQATSHAPSPIPSRTCSPTPSPHNSFYCAAKKIMRSSGGMKSQQQTYGFHDQEEEEEQDQAEAEMEADSQEEDDWYEHPRHDLAELETQPSNCAKTTCDKLLQTDSYDTTSSDYTDKDTESQTSQRFKATTDKGVNTSGDERKPVKIVRIYKCSTLKSKSKKNQSKGDNKVRFQGKDVAKPNKSRDKFSNPFLLKNKEELPTKTNQTASSLSKFRVLKSMSESIPDPQRRRYSVQEAAKFQRQLEEEQEKLKVPKDFECRPLRCTCSRHSRCKGGSDRIVELLPTYPSGWSQLSMGD